MNRIGIFELHIQPGNELVPARVQVALQRPTIDAAGRVLVTPEVTSLEEIEGQINVLQDDLDQLRERARSDRPVLEQRTFTRIRSRQR